MEALLFLATVVLVGWFVTVPLRARSEGLGERAEVVALRAARDAKLREIRDTELDFATGKLTHDDYAVTDAALRSEAAELLRRLEDARGEQV